MFLLIGALENGEFDVAEYETTRVAISEAFREASDFYRSLADSASTEAQPLSRAEAQFAALPDWFSFRGIFMAEEQSRQAPALLSNLADHLGILSQLSETLKPSDDRQRLAGQIFQMMGHWAEAAELGRALAVFLRDRSVLPDTPRRL
jgi:hypothetical protein